MKDHKTLLNNIIDEKSVQIFFELKGEIGQKRVFKGTGQMVVVEQNTIVTHQSKRQVPRV